ncbi:DUF3035 domain-containing protein [Acidomonas methanolica]|uniref:DUF3035 domain-containing protein n=2 Tax=Acidomonas methanolica TaxID=437 RepID=A0A023D3S3_ACIMT|nr:DUF3035 domain-containing protein [Acidomonas methanolica]MBU2654808.1 DUF3035 domain-containing protein [Acidomonas methanolica]TCS26472.1 beta-barrel assembly complex subunit BamF [Acidomonas methanolica]GAJ28425.1 hypothetical protein Amme_023_018 [Acidomonas methanolica NBRC 104435]GEK99220.1 hypothetical protein AME01nite_17190 [Acidomonas methanolica NBRC 104435]
MAQIVRPHRLIVLPLTGAALMLAGCSGSDISRAFSLERETPDEYTVTTRAPLSMPPSEKLNLPGAAPPAVDQSPRMQALETLSPNAALHPIDGSPSAGQSTLVSEVDRSSKAPENAELGAAGAGFVDSLMFWHGGSAGSVVDGAAENRRLHKESALGRKPDTGATPTIHAADSKFLGVF